jgi:hypothetical protein
MPGLLRPVDDIVYVEGILQDGFHEGLVVAFHLPGQSGYDSGTALAQIDTLPPGASVFRRNPGVDIVLVFTYLLYGGLHHTSN